MTTDDQMRAALRMVADEPAPPAVTTLDQVVRRGRRRVLAQRGATIAAVAGFVVAIGIGGAMLRSTAEGEKTAVPPASPSSTAAPTTTGPVVPTTAERSAPVLPLPSGAPVPPSEKYRTTLLPGWEEVDKAPEGSGCGRLPSIGVAPGMDVPSQDVVEPAFMDAVAEHADSKPLLVTGSWRNVSPETGGPYTFREYQVEMAGGPGGIVLEAGHVQEGPVPAADSDARLFGNCEVLQRKVLPDGTVMQLYPADFASPETPSQHVVVYRPSGRQYVVVTQGWSDSDVVNGAVSQGRGRLPIDDSGLASIAEMLAEMGT